MVEVSRTAVLLCPRSDGGTSATSADDQFTYG